MKTKEINIFQKYLKRINLNHVENEIRDFVVLVESLSINREFQISWIDLALGVKDIQKTTNLIIKAIEWEKAWKIEGNMVRKI